ncbi:MAG: hypothetical protein EKK41_11565 [Hyphomicrobiales bacterium]|nr:MAG: hypothetical protein EKK41_11565 [Hyphomicrobiales bacterium]
MEQFDDREFDDRVWARFVGAKIRERMKTEPTLPAHIASLLRRLEEQERTRKAVAMDGVREEMGRQDA